MNEGEFKGILEMRDTIISQLIECNNRLLKENREFKKHVEGSIPSHYVDMRGITDEVFVTIINGVTRKYYREDIVEKKVLAGRMG